MDSCRGRGPSEHVCNVRAAVICSQGDNRAVSEVLTSVDREHAIAGDIREAAYSKASLGNRRGLAFVQSR